MHSGNANPIGGHFVCSVCNAADMHGLCSFVWIVGVLKCLRYRQWNDCYWRRQKDTFRLKPLIRMEEYRWYVVCVCVCVCCVCVCVSVVSVCVSVCLCVCMYL